MTVKCQGCGIDYPAELVNPCFTNGGIAQLCGICALEVGNSILPPSQRRSKFFGPVAEAMRLKAIEHRKKIGRA
jgi:hypothetical protein